MKLTEKEYREIDLFISDNCNHSFYSSRNRRTDYSWRLEQARKKGWVQKTALEELNDYVEKIQQIRIVVKMPTTDYWRDKSELQFLIKQAIEEEK